MGRYIVVPVPRDSADAQDAFSEVVRRQYPTWEGADGDPMTLVRDAVAVLYTDVAELATRVGEELFRYFGRGLAGLPPLDERSAHGQVTFTSRDTDGPYIVPEGLEVTGKGPLGESLSFRVLASVVIANGESTAVADVEAVEEGIAFNSVSGTVDLSEFVDYLEPTAELVGSTSGGRDREDDEPYLDRLGDELGISSPRPVLPAHFPILARKLGAYRATVIDGLDPTDTTNAVFEVETSGGADPGLDTFALVFESPAPDETTADLPYNVTAGDAQTALEALLSIDPGDVIVTGGPADVAPLVIEFAGGYAGQSVAVSATDAGAATATLTQTQTAVAGTTGNRATVAVAMIDEAGAETADWAAIIAALQAMREVGWAVHPIHPTYSAIDVAWEGTAYPGFDPAAVLAAGNEAVASYLSPALYGVREDTGELREWLNDPLIRYLEVAERLQRVEGLWTVDSLEIALAGGTLDTVNVTMPGFAPLPQPGDIDGDVSAP